MVGEIFADAGEIGTHLDAEPAQVPRRPDAGAHQERRRMYAAGGEDDLARAQPPLLTLDPRADADDAAAVEQQAGRGGAVDDGQITARANRRVEVADRRRCALVR